MQTIHELVESTKRFRLFKVVQKDILVISNKIKSKIWTLEILTRHLNEIIESFLNTRETQIDAFFEIFLVEKYADDLARKQKFCFTLLLSILFFSPKHNYIKLYYNLFAEEADSEIYNFFWELKNMILELKFIREQKFTNLDRVYLSQKHWHVVLNYCLGFEFEQIREFEQNLLEKISQIKHQCKSEKVIDYTRNAEYSATFFMRECLLRFAEMHFMVKHKVSERLAHGSAEHRLSQLEQRQYQKTIQRVSLARASRLTGANLFENQGNSLNAKLMEKERLLAEIKNTVQLTNSFKNSAVRLICYIDEVDPLAQKIKESIEKLVRVFIQMRRENLKGVDLANFSSQLSQKSQGLLENGPSIVCKNATNIKQNLLRLDKRIYNELSERAEDFKPIVRSLIRSLRRIIFSQEFTLANDQKAKDLGELRREVERVFGKYGFLENSQRMILETFFKNLESEGNEAPQVENLIDRISHKLSAAVKLGLNEGQEGENEDLEMFEQELRDTFKAEMGKRDLLGPDEQDNGVSTDPQFTKKRYSSRPLGDIRSSIKLRESFGKVQKPNFINFVRQKGSNSIEGRSEVTRNANANQPQSLKTGFDTDFNREWNEEDVGTKFEEEIPEGTEFVQEPGKQSQTRKSEPVDKKSTAQVNSEQLIDTHVSRVSLPNKGKPAYEEMAKSNSKADPMILKSENEANKIPEVSDSVSFKKPSQPNFNSSKRTSLKEVNSSEKLKQLPTFNTFNQDKKSSDLQGPKTSAKTSNLSNKPSSLVQPQKLSEIKPEVQTSQVPDTFANLEGEQTAKPSKTSGLNPAKTSALSRQTKANTPEELPAKAESLVKGPTNLSEAKKFSNLNDRSKHSSSQNHPPKTSELKQDEQRESQAKANSQILEPPSEESKPKEENHPPKQPYNSKIPLMKSKQGLRIAQEIGLIDDGKPKSIKNFFKSFWGK